MNLAFAGCEIDLDRQELRRAGEIVHVEPQVYDPLIHLLRGPGLSARRRRINARFPPYSEISFRSCAKSWLSTLVSRSMMTASRSICFR